MKRKHLSTESMCGSSYLLWDPYRERMYANNEDTWWTLTPTPNESMELDVDQVAFGVGSYLSGNYVGSSALFLGRNGDYLYKSMIRSQTVYSFNSSGEIEYVTNLTSRTAPSTRGQREWSSLCTSAVQKSM